MQSAFYGQKNATARASGLTGVSYGNGQLATPPDDYGFPASPGNNGATGSGYASAEVAAWMEVWDYGGGASFRGFIVDKNDGEEKTAFVFFDASVVGRDLKQA
jgi:hypothetical protein